MRWRAHAALPSAALMVGFLLSPGSARAQDACGDITVRGACDGNVLSYCSRTNELVVLDCGQDYFPVGVQGGVCVEVDAEYGFDCALPTGGDCVFSDEGSYLSTFCAEPGDGCSINIENGEGFVCTANMPACERPAAGELYQPTCSGDYLYFDCLPGDQPVAIDCAAAGGTCGTDVCVMPVGETCDNVNFFCDGDLICEGYDILTNASGTCVAASTNTDAGPAPQVDAGPVADAGAGDTDAGQSVETCDGVTFNGECDDKDAVFCSDRNDDPNADLVRYTCGALLVGDDTFSGTCDILSDWGSWCVFPTGTDCAFLTTAGDIAAFGCGDAQGVLATSACSTNIGCVENVGTCDPTTYSGDSCQGTFLARYCNPWGQFYGLDCAGEGNGTCDASGNEAVCRAGVGGRCEVDTVFECAAGLVCTDLGGESSVCVDPNAPLNDAGTPDADAGTEPSDAGDSPVDAGASPAEDAGTPPAADAGTPTPSDDAGTTTPVEPCNGACGLIAYDECTCGADDPCNWSNDGYCDEACALYNATPFDDSGDCPVVGPEPGTDAGPQTPTEDAGPGTPSPSNDAGAPPAPAVDAGNGGNGDDRDDIPVTPTAAESGCGCSSSSEGTSIGLFGLGLFAAFRRRRRRD